MARPRLRSDARRRLCEDLGLINEDGSENPALVVFKRDGDKVRLFWASEMTGEMADPGQDPRDAPDIASLWSILDLTPGGRGTDWYPKLATERFCEEKSRQHRRITSASHTSRLLYALGPRHCIPDSRDRVPCSTG